MTTTGHRLRQSAYCNAFDVGLTYSRKFAFYAGPVGGRYAVDLTDYDTVELIVFDPNTGTKIEKFTATVLTATADKENDESGTPVANKCTVTITPAGAAGDYLFHIVGALSGAYYQLAAPARVGYYAAPAVT